MTTTEELFGLIKGLGEAVKGQLKAHSESQAELQQLTAAVGNLVESSFLFETHTQNLCHKTRPP